MKPITLYAGSKICKKKIDLLRNTSTFTLLLHSGLAYSILLFPHAVAAAPILIMTFHQCSLDVREKAAIEVDGLLSRKCHSQTFS